MMHKIFAILLITSFTLIQAISQDSKTDVFLFDITIDGDSLTFPETCYYLNSFNADGYNGHLSFINDNEVILCSNLNPDNSKTSEIISLDLYRNDYKRLTINNRLEAYPQLLKNETLSFIEFSNFGDSYLYIGDYEDLENRSQIFTHLDNIHSASWLSEENVILNLKSDLSYMAVGYKSDDTFKIMEANVSSRIVPIDESNFYYIHKLKSDKWYLKTYDINFLKKKTVIEMPQGVDDFDLLSDGSIICGNGSILYRYSPGKTKVWTEVIDLSAINIGNIQEVRANGSKLILVNQVN